MDLLWMILLLFLVCAEAENVTEVKMKLGQNITLACSADIENIYWYMEIHSQFKVSILRTFGKTDNSPLFTCSDFKTKYSVLENKLVITNVTAEDCRLYFCARKKNDAIHFEDKIHLVLDIAITPTNKLNNQAIWQRETIMLSLATINFLFIVVIIGLLFAVLYLKRKIDKNQSAPLTSENVETVEMPQYEEIEPRLPPPATPVECIYYKAQLPLSTLPQRNRP